MLFTQKCTPVYAVVVCVRDVLFVGRLNSFLPASVGHGGKLAHGCWVHPLKPSSSVSSRSRWPYFCLSKRLETGAIQYRLWMQTNRSCTHCTYFRQTSMPSSTHAPSTDTVSEADTSTLRVADSCGRSSTIESSEVSSLMATRLLVCDLKARTHTVDDRLIDKQNAHYHSPVLFLRLQRILFVDAVDLQLHRIVLRIVLLENRFLKVLPDKIARIAVSTFVPSHQPAVWRLTLSLDNVSLILRSVGLMIVYSDRLVGNSSGGSVQFSP